MFPDDHTKLNGISDTKRAFFMGNALVVDVIENDNLGVTLKGRAFRYNLFVRSSQKGFSLQSLTQNVA